VPNVGQWPRPSVDVFVDKSRILPALFVIHVCLEALARPIDIIDIEQEYLDLDPGRTLIAVGALNFSQCH
jgi:hypothetical protein